MLSSAYYMLKIGYSYLNSYLKRIGKSDNVLRNDITYTKEFFTFRTRSTCFKTLVHGLRHSPPKDHVDGSKSTDKHLEAADILFRTNIFALLDERQPQD
jgi:hypothetical protein